MKLITCKECSSIFINPRRGTRKREFCNNECKYAWRKKNPFMLGVKFSEEHRKNMSIARIGKVGKLSGNWRGGIDTPEHRSWIKNKRNRILRSHARGNHSYEEWKELKAEYGFMCLNCKKVEPTISLTEDHIIPLSKGGSDDISNIQPLCKICNLHKFVKVIDFRELELTEKL